MEKIYNIIPNLADVLVDNNRYRNRKLSAEQISAESFSTWQSLINDLHTAAYKVYCLCENNKLDAESTTVDKSEVFDAIRNILAVIGDINGHKVYATAELAILVIGYAGKRGNTAIGELAQVMDDIVYYNTLLKHESKYPNGKEDMIANLENKLAELNEKKKSLIKNTPDVSETKPTKTSPTAFRKEMEKKFARIISGQLAKSPEELEAEELARKEARKASAKARKAKREAAEKKSK